MSPLEIYTRADFQILSGHTCHKIHNNWLNHYQKDLQKSQQFRQVCLEDLALRFELILILLQPAMK